MLNFGWVLKLPPKICGRLEFLGRKKGWARAAMPYPPAACQLDSMDFFLFLSGNQDFDSFKGDYWFAGFKSFLFSSRNLGKMIQFWLPHMFQMGR